MSDCDSKCMFDKEQQWLEVLEWNDGADQTIMNLMGDDSQPKKDFVFNRIDFEGLMR